MTAVLTSTPPLDAVLDDPGWHLYGVEAGAGRVEFATVDRATLSAAPFADYRLQPAQVRPFPLADVLAAWAERRRPVAVPFIFHTAFCCSTLLARSLDREGACLALKEPRVLQRLAEFKRSPASRQLDPGQWMNVVEMSLGLLTRRFAPDEVVLIKPSNVSNNLLPELLRLSRGTLLLYSRLEAFLVSILTKSEPGRIFGRQLFAAIAGDSERTARVPPAQWLKLTDLQIAALVWHLQIDAYRRALAGAPATRLATLDAERLLADPAARLADVQSLFALGYSMAHCAAIVNGPVWQHHSKAAAADYDAAARAREYAEAAAQHRAELDMTLAWARQVRPDGAIPDRLPRAL